MVQAADNHQAIVDSLIQMAEEYTDKFDSMDYGEFKSPRIDLTARQCLHDNMVLTVTKANVPGLTIQKYKDYRQNMP